MNAKTNQTHFAASIATNMDTPSFAQRLKILAHGIGARKDTRAYKMAIAELIQMSSLAVAVFLTVFITLLLVMLTVRDPQGAAAITEAAIIEVVEPTKLDEPPPPIDIPIDPVTDMEHINDVMVHNVIDNAPPAEIPSPKPAKLDTVAIIKSPVMMKGIFGSRTPGAEGGNTGFGYKTRLDSDLVGTLYDFKRDAKGNARRADYWRDLGKILTSGFSPAVLNEFYKIPRELYLSHLFIPYVQAEEGPEAFGAGDLMQATQWVAVYSGTLTPQVPGTYRFVGDFDDYIGAVIDGKVVLDAAWDATTPTGWRSKENAAHRNFTGRNLVYGDWVTFDGSPRKIDIIVGERPGGMIGGVLLVQNKDTAYETAADGRPVLPVFSTSPLSFAEVERTQSLPNFKIDRITPVMNLTKEQRDTFAKQKAAYDEKEVEVTITF